MQVNPKVSIITCFWNVETFLEECIESILRQTHRLWELLLVDDGSTDGSTAIAKRYAEEFPDKIFYIEHCHHENKGLSVSRNAALKSASGDLIAFLDGDDIWLPSYLSDIIQRLQRSGAAMVCEASQYWHSWNDKNQQDYKIMIGAEPDKLYQPTELLQHLYPLGKGAAPCICGLIVQRKAILDCGGFEKSFHGMYEDQALLVKLYQREKIYISSACNNKYRQRNSSLVYLSRSTGNYGKERKRFLTWMRYYFRQNGWLANDTKKALDLALFPYDFPVLNYVGYRLPQKAKRWLSQNCLFF